MSLRKVLGHVHQHLGERKHVQNILCNCEYFFGKRNVKDLRETQPHGTAKHCLRNFAILHFCTFTLLRFFALLRFCVRQKILMNAVSAPFLFSS